MPSLRLSAVVIFACCFALLGCSTSPDEPEPDHRDDWLAPDIDTAQLYDRAGAAIPEETRLVGAVTGPAIWELLDASLLPIAAPQAEPGDRGTVEGLRDELSETTRAHYGVDPGDIEGALVLVDEQGWIGAVILGEFSPPAGAQHLEVDGHDAWEMPIEPPQLRFAFGSPSSNVYATEQSDAGIVLMADGYDNLVRMLHNDAGAPPPDIPISASMAETTGAQIAVAVDMDIDTEQTYQTPERGLLSIGDEARLSLFGSPDDLEATRQVYDDRMATIHDDLASLYQNDNLEYWHRMLAIYAYHGITALDAHMEPTLDDNRLDYTADVDGLAVAVPLSRGIIWAGWHSIDAMEQASERTAEMEVNQLEVMIETYDMTHRELPENLDALTEGRQPLTDEIPDDPWGNSYIYNVDGPQDFEVFSKGPDETKGTDHDIYAD